MHRFLDLNPDLKEEFDSFGDLVLHPDISERIDKDLLRKTTDSFNSEAIEHCSIALAENDLNGETKNEFLDLLSRSEELRTEAEIYKNLKLVPDNTVYDQKPKLKRIPLRLGFTKVAVRVLAIAAAASIIVLLSVFLPGQKDSSYSFNTSYLLPFNNSLDLAENEMLTGYTPVLVSSSITEPASRTDKNQVVELAQNKEPEREIITIDQNPYLKDVLISSTPAHSQLLAMSETDPVMADFTGEDLSPRQFVAMNFRKLFLREEIENASKIKVYEVADASINGLNKLLGWEMQFEKEKTEDGRLSSYKFSSQLLNLDRKTKNIIDEL
jgi:hypothetical protein